MSKAIICGPLLCVAEYFIGFIDFNEAGFRSLLFVGIRMVLFGKMAIRFFHLIVGCTPGYTEYFIIISFISSHQLVLYVRKQGAFSFALPHSMLICFASFDVTMFH